MRFHMITSASPNKKIWIHITTYKPDWTVEMEEKCTKKPIKPNKFVCAICLNSKNNEKNTECNKKINKPCPICLKSCDQCQNTKQKAKVDDLKSNVKNVQTSDTNVSQGLNLLNEVLTVFQNKKVDVNKEKLKSGLFKDAAVSTEDFNKKPHPRLTVSTFHYSIGDNKKQENGKFTVLSSCQPDFIRNRNSIDLIKHKSSSIPQMKMEELKYSLKEKSRSKDAIEEVNRMFATVRKAGKNIENSNRPVVRSGPRVLPVVKNLVRQEMKNVNVESSERISCKCCQTCMSSGDSSMKRECCHEVDDKCVYTMCCHYPNKVKQQSGVICEQCRSLNDEYNCEHGNCDENYCH
ncbi:uncharacterized protein LOC142984351 [Anticarsia gemmatalis]|uniref:uncharacterized protein LOC142984351 n=1 Tax=Anticarsia gemmatalis TaxID=129554 RepID=UPI003F7759AB